MSKPGPIERYELIGQDEQTGHLGPVFPENLLSALAKYSVILSAAIPWSGARRTEEP